MMKRQLLVLVLLWLGLCSGLFGWAGRDELVWGVKASVLENFPEAMAEELGGIDLGEYGDWEEDLLLVSGIVEEYGQILEKERSVFSERGIGVNVWAISYLLKDDSFTNERREIIFDTGWDELRALNRHKVGDRRVGYIKLFAIANEGFAKVRSEARGWEGVVVENPIWSALRSVRDAAFLKSYFVSVMEAAKFTELSIGGSRSAARWDIWYGPVKEYGKFTNEGGEFEQLRSAVMLLGDGYLFPDFEVLPWKAELVGKGLVREREFYRWLSQYHVLEHEFEVNHQRLYDIEGGLFGSWFGGREMVQHLDELKALRERGVVMLKMMEEIRVGLGGLVDMGKVDLGEQMDDFKGRVEFDLRRIDEDVKLAEMSLSEL